MTETIWLAIISTFGGLLTVAITFIGTLMIKRMDAAAEAAKKSEEERKERNKGIDEKLTQIHTLTNSTASEMKSRIDLLTEKLLAAVTKEASAQALIKEMQAPTTGPVVSAAPTLQAPAVATVPASAPVPVKLVLEGPVPVVVKKEDK